MKVAFITTNEERFLDFIVPGLVITNSPLSRIFGSCQMKGVECVLVDNADFSKREEHDSAIMNEIEKRGIDLIVLFAYRRLIKNKEFLDKYKGRLINVHNSFLPEFSGFKPHEKAFEKGVKESGYSIHFVEEGMDEGEVIFQEKVDISQCESSQEVYDKITEASCIGLKKFLESKTYTS